MEDYRIRATLGVKPENYSPERPEMLYITRGATEPITYNVGDLVYYQVADLEQLTFMFKQGKTFYRFDMYDESGAQDSHFEIEDEKITFWLHSDDTNRFKPTKSGNLVKFEVIATMKESGAVIIEPQLPIIVVDSLISQYEEIDEDEE